MGVVRFDKGEKQGAGAEVLDVPLKGDTVTGENGPLFRRSEDTKHNRNYMFCDHAWIELCQAFWNVIIK